MTRAHIALVLMILALVGCSTPKGPDPEAQLRLKQQCREAGEKARAEWIARYPEEHFSDAPEYVYNSQLKTCLYCDTYVDFGPYPLFPGVKSRADRFILD